MVPGQSRVGDARDNILTIDQIPATHLNLPTGLMASDMGEN